MLGAACMMAVCWKVQQQPRRPAAIAAAAELGVECSHHILMQCKAVKTIAWLAQELNQAFHPACTPFPASRTERERQA